METVPLAVCLPVLHLPAPSTSLQLLTIQPSSTPHRVLSPDADKHAPAPQASEIGRALRHRVDQRVVATPARARAHHRPQPDEVAEQRHAHLVRLGAVASQEVGMDQHERAQLHAVAQLLGAGGARINGAVVVHPYFLGAVRVASEETDPAMARSVVTMWRVVCPGSAGVDDPWINPLAAAAPGLRGLACGRVLVCLAEKDVVRDRGRAYAEGLGASGWAGKVEVLEVAGQGHCFHLVDFACADAVKQDDAIARFVNL